MKRKNTAEVKLLRRNRLKIKNFKYYELTASTFYGLILTAILIILFGYAGLHVDLPSAVVSIMLFISISSGGILSGYIYGKKKRHGGIKGGFICGTVMFTAIAVFGIIYFRKIPSTGFVKYLPVLCVSGAAGGVGGVNTRIKRPPV